MKFRATTFGEQLVLPQKIGVSVGELKIRPTDTVEAFALVPTVEPEGASP